VLLYAARHYGGHVFDVAGDGRPDVWRYLFSFFAHPAVWALVVPALGAVSDVIVTFSHRPFRDHRLAVAALAVIGALAFVGWTGDVHSGDYVPSRQAIGGVLVFLPVLALIGLWLDTLLHGRPALESPILHALGFIAALVLAIPGGALAPIFLSCPRVGQPALDGRRLRRRPRRAAARPEPRRRGARPPRAGGRRRPVGGSDPRVDGALAAAALELRRPARHPFGPSRRRPAGRGGAGGCG